MKIITTLEKKSENIELHQLKQDLKNRDSTIKKQGNIDDQKQKQITSLQDRLAKL